MTNNFHEIELDILQSFYNLRKKALKDPNNQDAIRHEWIKDNIQEKLILKTVSKPKFLKRLFYLVVDENFWQVVDIGLHKRDRRFFIELIYLFNGLRSRHNSLDDLIENVIENIAWLERWLRDKQKVNYKFDTETEDASEKYRSCILSILKDSREYLESISIIWKWNEIKNSNDSLSFNVHNFTLHGFHKIIRGKLQSTRNRWSLMTTKNKKEKLFINSNKIHSFLKPNNVYEGSKKISTLPTKIINEILKEEGYATSNWLGFADSKIVEEVINLRTTSKKIFNELTNKIGFNSEKLKIILFGDYAHQEFLPILENYFKLPNRSFQTNSYQFLCFNSKLHG